MKKASILRWRLSFARSADYFTVTFAIAIMDSAGVDDMTVCFALLKTTWYTSPLKCSFFDANVVAVLSALYSYVSKRQLFSLCHVFSACMLKLGSHTKYFPFRESVEARELPQGGGGGPGSGTPLSFGGGVGGGRAPDAAVPLTTT